MGARRPGRSQADRVPTGRAVHGGPGREVPGRGPDQGRASPSSSTGSSPTRPAPQGVRRRGARPAGRQPEGARPAPADPGPVGRRRSGRWVIVAGERRWRAAAAGRPADARSASRRRGRRPADEILEDQLVENCVREDLKPIEQARAFQALLDRRGVLVPPARRGAARLPSGRRPRAGAARPAGRRPGEGRRRDCPRVGRLGGRADRRTTPSSGRSSRGSSPAQMTRDEVTARSKARREGEGAGGQGRARPPWTTARGGRPTA